MKNYGKYTMLKFILPFLFCFVAFSASAEISAVQKIDGQCPGTYRGSGAWCNPTATSTKAIPRKQGCPLHFKASGPFCVGWSKREDAVEKIAGSCPSNWIASGSWCVKIE